MRGLTLLLALLVPVGAVAPPRGPVPLAKAYNLPDLASTATERTHPGLEIAATASTATSGRTVPPLNGAYTWSVAQVSDAAVSSEIGSSITQSGALCNGTNDDTAIINAYLKRLTNGGLVYVPANHMCLINSGNLNIPANVRISGAASVLGAMGPASATTGLFLNPAHSITMAAGAALQNLAVLRAGLRPNPTDAQVIAAVTQWGNENSNAIAIAGAGVRLEHLSVEGFNTAISDYGYGDYIISDVVGDDYNGIYIAWAGDNSLISDTRFEPFYCIRSKSCSPGTVVTTSVAQSVAGQTLQFAAGSLKGVQVGDLVNILSPPGVGLVPLGDTVTAVSSAAGLLTLATTTAAAVPTGAAVTIGGGWARPGTSFYLQGSASGTTGWYCERCFSLMYRGGVTLDGVGIGHLNMSDVEWDNSNDPGTNGVGVVGVRVVGSSAGVTISNTSSGGYSIEFSDEISPTNGIYLRALQLGWPDLLSGRLTGPNGIAGAYFRGLTNSPTRQTLSGTVAAGNRATITVNGTTVSYTATAGDSLLNVAAALTRRLNSAAALAAEHISVAWSRNTLTIYAPAALNPIITTATTGGITLTSSTMTADQGSWATLNGYTYPGNSVPAIVVGPNLQLPVVISGIPINNAGGYAGAFSIDSTSTALVQLLDYPAGRISAVSSCGKGSAVSSNANDKRGTITEGAGAAGCTLTFRTPWPVIPVCMVSSPTGAPITSYSVTKLALTIVNRPASGNEYTYQCEP